jgi:hypothetical protein
MRLRPLPLVLAFASLVSFACADDEPTVTPVDGLWDYIPEGIDNNTCPDFVPVAAFHVALTFELDYDGGDGFQVDMGDQMDIVCNLTGGQSVSCPDRLYLTSEVPELNLDLEYYIDVEGVFDNDAEIHGTRHLSVRCIGEGCGALDDIPCSADLEFRAEAQ